MNRSNAVLRSVASNWMALAVNIAVSFFLAPFVVNKLGSVYYGIWALTLQFTGYLYLLDFGVRESVVRYTSKYNARHQGDRLNAVLTTTVRIYLPITLACVMLAVGAAAAITSIFEVDAAARTEARWATLLVGLTVAQAFIFNVFSGIQYGLQQFQLANSISVALTIVRAGVIVLALMAGHGIVSLAVIQFASAMIGGLTSAWLATRALRKAGMPFRLVQLGSRRRRALRQRILGYGGYVLVSNIGQKLIFASGALVVGLFLPVASVAYYAIAGSLIDNLRTLLGTTASVFNPLSSHLHALGRSHAVGEVLRIGGKFAVLVALPIALTFVLRGGEFIGLWMGREYAAEAGSVLLVMAVTQVFSAPHYIVSSVLYGISQHRIIALLRIGEAALNLLLSILLVRSLGLVGVPIGAGIAHVLVVVLLLPSRACRVVGLSLLDYYLAVVAKPLLAAIPFGVMSFWMAGNYPASDLLHFFLQVAAALAVYIPSVYLLAFSEVERALVRRMVGLSRRTTQVPSQG